MSSKIRKQTNQRQIVRLQKKVRIQRKIRRSRVMKPRLVVFRSNNFIYAQVIDDQKKHTLVQANTSEKDFEGSKSKKNLAAAKTLGQLIAKRAVASQVTAVVFDRNGYDYHGRVKALADGAREGGLQF